MDKSSGLSETWTVKLRKNNTFAADLRRLGAPIPSAPDPVLIPDLPANLVRLGTGVLGQRCPLMWVTMMHIGIVSVVVYQRRVNMRVTVRFASVKGKVRMLVVLIMRVGVCMFLLLVCV